MSGRGGICIFDLSLPTDREVSLNTQWLIKQLETEKEYRCNRGETGAEKGLCYALEIVDDTSPAQEWIPITTRPMTEDERKEWSEQLDFNISDDEEAIIYCNLPDDGQRVLVYHKYSGEVGIDTFFDDDEGCYFEENGDMDGITHWMPLPEPPKEEK